MRYYSTVRNSQSIRTRHIWHCFGLTRECDNYLLDLDATFHCWLVGLWGVMLLCCCGGEHAFSDSFSIGLDVHNNLL